MWCAMSNIIIRCENDNGDVFHCGADVKLQFLCFAPLIGKTVWHGKFMWHDHIMVIFDMKMIMNVGDMLHCTAHVKLRIWCFAPVSGKDICHGNVMWQGHLTLSSWYIMWWVINRVISDMWCEHVVYHVTYFCDIWYVIRRWYNDRAISVMSRKNEIVRDLSATNDVLVFMWMNVDMQLRH